ncbi:AraC-type DNA-binding protein [Abditibacterium utsteinense]|uniref:AraC-type DNA-binding protein n=1 Tax=Abditibacterium utsteinense TaxID=1960156 RepID=A0A2S8SS77_9BACT|nr:AraC family transcriptional regulator [Abditibacterium utsteinense]PQV63589.1 AraC-type DNA-binding protein [Abditibacterium utsteinense]
MFETPFTRRQMIEVVQHHLLPWAWRREDQREAETPIVASPKRLLLLQPPLQLPPEIQVTQRIVEPSQMRRGKPAPGRGSFSSHVLWPELGLHSIPFAWLGFLFQGEIDLRIGANRSLIFGPGGEGKIQIVSLKAPTFFVIPPGVPHPDGHHIPWERPLHLMREEPQIFWVHVSPSGLRCHLSRVAQGHYQEEFFVLLHNEALMGLSKLFIAEMQRPERFPLVVEAALLSLSLEINKSLLGPDAPESHEKGNETGLPSPISSVREELAGSDAENNRSASKTHIDANTVLIEAAKRYIEMHLNWRTLSLDMVAHHVYVSPSHLNRLFKAELGMTLKEYIQGKRIGVAKALLEESDIAVSEVGFLSGFFPPSHFARAFSQAVGITPKKFRDEQRSARLEHHAL